ncbi:unnamed protein product [Polarella glacialis]|uniref:AB hydrolase-1 domain-containing protein n=2 Tax=Polarella glacialis TaxID=89957 RepID=A0A813HML9_POLGL|nr:unnamed protein product [Polarella glacialis]
MPAAEQFLNADLFYGLTWPMVLGTVLAVPCAAFWPLYAGRRNSLSWWQCFPSVSCRVESFVATPLGQVHYRRRGVGKSKVLVVMLAGIGHDSSYWPEVMEAVSQNHEFIALDLFGRGATDAGRGPYDADGFAGLVRAALASLDLAHRPLAMVGFSFGGAVAAHFAAGTAEVIGSLLIVPAGIALTPSFGAGLRFLKGLPRGLADLVGVLASLGGLLCFGHTGRTQDTTEAGYEERASRVWRYSAQDFLCNPSFFRAYMRTLRDFPMGSEDADLQKSFKQLQRLGPRLEIILATTDTIVPAKEVHKFLVSELPEARVVEVRGGHDVQWDRPDHTSQLILDFLGRLKLEVSK